MVGPIINSASLAVGALAGAAFGKWLPDRLKESLPLLFGVITIGLGAPLIVRTDTMHVVTLALIAGTFIGEFLDLEERLNRSLKRLLSRLGSSEVAENESNFIQFVTLISLFCFGSLGFFGAVDEGITRVPDLLLTKAVLDFFAAMIFAVLMGYTVALIAIPQFIILASLYLAAGMIMPLVSEAMLNDFAACGGMIFIATGLRMCEIKIFRIINMLPSLLLVFLLTRMWELL